MNSLCCVKGIILFFEKKIVLKKSTSFICFHKTLGIFFHLTQVTMVSKFLEKMFKILVDKSLHVSTKVQHVEISSDREDKCLTIAVLEYFFHGHGNAT